MKLKPNFMVYNMADEYMLIPAGEEMATFGGTIILNEVSAFLLDQIKDEHKTMDQLVEAVLEKYEVDEATAKADAIEAIEALKQNGVIED